MMKKIVYTMFILFTMTSVSFGQNIIKRSLTINQSLIITDTTFQNISLADTLGATADSERTMLSDINMNDFHIVNNHKAFADVGAIDSAETTLTDADTFYVLQNIFAPGNAGFDHWAFSADSLLTYTGKDSLITSAAVSFSASLNTNLTTRVTWGVNVNGIFYGDEATMGRDFTNIGLRGSTGVTKILKLGPGDNLQLVVKCNRDNIIITHEQIIVALVEIDRIR